MAKKTRKRPRTDRKALWFLLLLVIGAFAAAWWLYPCLYNPSPQFNFILVEKNDQPLKLISGEVLRLHPRDRIRILKISSNICFNRGFRLFAGGFDVNALFHEKLTVSTFLPNRDPFDRYAFSVVVKHDNRDLGHVDLLVEPHTEDWLDKANRTIDGERRIALLEKALTHAPGEVRIRDSLIQTYKSLKKWPEAARMLEKLAEEKADRRVLDDLLQVYEAASDTDGIISVLKRLVELEPEDVEARIRLASTLEGAERLRESIRVYEGVLKKLEKGEGLPIYKTLGYLFTKTGQDKEAVSAYLKALDLDKKDPNLYYNLSSLYEKTGQQDKADAFLAKALGLKSEDLEGRLSLAERLMKTGKMKEAEKHLSQVLEKSPRSMEALLLMIRIAEARQDKEALIGTYEKIHSLEPENETVIYNLGVLEYERGDPEKGLPYFLKLAALHPGDREIHSFLFDIYKRLKKDLLAFKEAQALSTLDPKEIGPYHFMFEYLNTRGDYTKLIGIMEKGLKALPDDVDLMKYLVLAYLKTGKEGLAIREMEKILKVHPKDLPLQLQLARLQEKKGDIRNALRTYENILALSPEHKEAREAYLDLLLVWADTLEEKEEFQEALKVYQKVLDLAPGHEKAGDAILRVSLQLARQQESGGRDREALQGYQRVLILSPGHGEAVEAYLRIMLRMARRLEGEEKFEEALQSYQKILNLSPGHEEAEEAYLRLRLKVLPGESEAQ